VLFVLTFKNDNLPIVTYLFIRVIYTAHVWYLSLVQCISNQHLNF